MTRIQWYILVGCIAVCSLILAGLYFLSPLSQNLFRANFDRSFTSEDRITKEGELDLDITDSYLAGIDDDLIYVGRRSNPFELIVADIKAGTKKVINLQVSDSTEFGNVPGAIVSVDPPYYYIAHGVLPRIYRGKLGNWKVERFMDDSAFFVDALPLTKNSFALRTNNAFTKQFELAKESKIDSPALQFRNGILKKQVDGLFCVDGSMSTDEVSKNLVYLYTYRNQYMVLDTNLHVVAEHHTIDTFSHAQIKVAYVESQGYSTLASPPAQINIDSWVSSNLLYVQSNLLARNEDQGLYERSSTIDVYDVTGGKYLYSFHIPDQHRTKVQDFRIKDQRLVGIFGRYLVTYDLGSNSDLKKEISER